MNKLSSMAIIGILVFANKIHALPTVVHSYISNYAVLEISDVPLIYIGDVDNPRSIDDNGSICEGSYEEDCLREPALYILCNPIMPLPDLCQLSEDDPKDPKSWRNWGTHFWDQSAGPDGGIMTSFNDDKENAYKRAYRLFYGDNDQPGCIKEYRSGNIRHAHYILGEIAHLLEDMGTPAHTHLDSHIGDEPCGLPYHDDDSFEEYVKFAFNKYDNFKTNVNNLKQNSNEKWAPLDASTLPDYGYPSEPLLFRLFYHMAQYTSQFDSDDNGTGSGRSIRFNKDISSKFDMMVYIFKPGQTDRLISGYGVSIKRKKLILYQSLIDYIKEEAKGGGIRIIYSDGTDEIWYTSTIENYLIENDMSDDQCENISQKIIPEIIKHVAGLYKLFWDTVKPVAQQILPNLAIYTPSGWDDNLVISTKTGDNVDAPSFSDEQDIYVDWAAQNNSESSAGSSVSKLYVDGNFVQSWSIDVFQPHYYADIEDFNIGKLSPGDHIITITHDANNAIAESNEQDNYYSRIINASSGPPSSGGEFFNSYWGTTAAEFHKEPRGDGNDVFIDEPRIYFSPKQSGGLYAVFRAEGYSSKGELRVRLYDPDEELYTGSALETVDISWYGPDAWFWEPTGWDTIPRFSKNGQWTFTWLWSANGATYKEVARKSLIYRYKLTNFELINPIAEDACNSRQNKKVFSTEDTSAGVWILLEGLSEDLEFWVVWNHSVTNLKDTQQFKISNIHSNGSFTLPYEKYCIQVVWPIKSKSRPAGEWKVQLFIKNAFDNMSLESERNFQITESIAPSINVKSISESVNIGDKVKLLVDATDNNLLNRVELFWDDGQVHKQIWDEIKNNSFHIEYTIGSYDKPVLIVYWAEVCDESGNLSSSSKFQIIVQNLCDAKVVSGPDCNNNGRIDSCDIRDEISKDCNGNGMPDECDITNGRSKDSNLDGIPDECVVLFNNGNFSGQQSNIQIGNSTQFVYDDFKLRQDSTITGIIWCQHDPTGFNYTGTRTTIYKGLPLPENLQFTGTYVASRSPNNTGLLFGFHGFDYSLSNLSISLPTGTYYLGIEAFGTGDLRVGWDQTNGGPDTIPGRRVVNQNFPSPGQLLPQDSVFSLIGITKDQCDIKFVSGSDCNNNGRIDSCDIKDGISKDSNGNGIPDECEPKMFIRSDSNADGLIDISDAVYTLLYLFLDGKKSKCKDAADADDSGQLDITDAIYTIDLIFLEGNTPPPPYIECGYDQTNDLLDCNESTNSCK